MRLKLTDCLSSTFDFFLHSLLLEECYYNGFRKVHLQTLRVLNNGTVFDSDNSTMLKKLLRALENHLFFVFLITVAYLSNSACLFAVCTTNLALYLASC